MKFDKLCKIVVPTISSYIHHTDLLLKFSTYPLKLSSQHLMNTIFLYKTWCHCNYDGFQWNWFRLTLNYDTISIASCINHTLEFEILWLNMIKVIWLNCPNLLLSKCNDFVNRITIKFTSHRELKKLKISLRLEKKMHFINNTIVVFCNKYSCIPTSII